MADIVIMNASLSPNPVQTGKPYIISVDIRDKIYVLDTGDGKALADSDGKAIETG